MKKLVSLILTVAVVVGAVFALQACSPDNKSQEESAVFDYDSLYSSNPTEPYAAPASGTTNRASYGYTLKAEQAYNDWSYLYYSGGAYAEMTYDGSAAMWQGGGASMKDDVMYPSETSDAVRGYDVTANGSATVYGNFRCADGDSAGATVSVFRNNTEIYRGTLEAGDTVGKYFEVSDTLDVGDKIYFVVKGAGAEVSFNPVVTYENSQNKSLYHLTTQGKQYGDVFPYYDEEQGKLYMGFLWSDNASGGQYHDALEISDNMLTFTDVPEAGNYDTWQYYKENYRMHFLYDCNRFIDRSKYTFGVRDNFLYFDEENQRYLLIAGCYYRFDSSAQTSDLVIYSSDDPYALSWTREGNVVEAGYSRNLPECPSLMKIGDRWYVFVSVAYNTAHQVGPLQYWTGDAGVDCMDVDWSDKEFSFLDGEDLCAARVTQVGEKVYMWGWIPATYDRMPWAPWAGYLNLPREVIQLPDGSLGGRLDPALTKLLNYGNVYTLGIDNYTVAGGNAVFENGSLNLTGQDNKVILGDGFNRNFITFTADMKDSNEIGYYMEQDGKRYEIVVRKSGGKLYMQVLSPDDPNHKTNSTIEINAASDVFDFKIVCDGEFVEFFVNDQYALTAHTAMDGASYRAGLISDGNATFSGVSINKLLPYGEIC